jgi:hypothetical protein
MVATLTPLPSTATSTGSSPWASLAVAEVTPSCTPIRISGKMLNSVAVSGAVFVNVIPTVTSITPASGRTS